MIASQNGVISTAQPESEYVHSGFTRQDETGQTIAVSCPVPYHQHFDGLGTWLTCEQANQQQRVGGRVIKNSGHQADGPTLPANLPR